MTAAVYPDAVSMLEGRRVTVTGAGGFIGAHLAARLVEIGAAVRGLVRYNSRDDPGALSWLDPQVAGEVEVVLGDLRDPESVLAALEGTDVVFHLGSQIAIPHSYVNPRDFFETNVLGTLNVAQAALARDVERVVHASTSEVYGSARFVPITESHPLEAQSPYSASKIGADKLMDSFHLSFDLPVGIVRPFNTYGPFQSTRAVIPTIITQALAGETVKLGSLHPRRDLTFVTDTAAGFIAAAEAPATVGETVQLGTGSDVSVGEIVDVIGDLLDRELAVEVEEPRIRPHASEVERLLSDPARMRELTGWTPEVDLREGLRRTIAWIEENLARYPVDHYVR